ncbi:hypothetical protein HDU67_002698 [Dinochytrium kinnereticum]|nr:hypothetical protein HDU67_002698 [Dinochytrium kinnereticum]
MTPSPHNPLPHPHPPSPAVTILRPPPLSRSVSAVIIPLLALLSVLSASLPVAEAQASLSQINTLFSNQSSCVTNCVIRNIPSVSSISYPLSSAEATRYCTALLGANASVSQLVVTCVAYSCETSVLEPFSALLVQCTYFVNGISGNSSSTDLLSFPTETSDGGNSSPSPSSGSTNPSGIGGKPSNTSSPSSSDGISGTNLIIAIAVPAGVLVIAVAILGAVIVGKRKKKNKELAAAAPTASASAPGGGSAIGGNADVASGAPPGGMYGVQGPPAVPGGQPQLLYVGPSGNPVPQEEWSRLSQPATGYYNAALPSIPPTSIPPSPNPPNISALGGSMASSNATSTFFPSPGSPSLTPANANMSGYQTEPIPPLSSEKSGSLFGSGLSSPYRQSEAGGSMSTLGSSVTMMSTSPPLPEKFGGSMQQQHQQHPMGAYYEKAGVMLNSGGGAGMSSGPGNVILPFKMSQASATGVGVSSNGMSETINPAVVARWSSLQVVVWLHSLGLREDIVLSLQEQKLDGAQLLQLTDARLQDLGVTSPPVRQTILSNAAALRGDTASTVGITSGGDVPPPYISQV